MNIFILGGGMFGTAIGNQLANNPTNKVVLFIRNKEQEQEINNANTNKRYFPYKKLNKSLLATTEASDLLNAQIIFIALPSKRIPKIIQNIKLRDPPK